MKTKAAREKTVSKRYGALVRAVILAAIAALVYFLGRRFGVFQEIPKFSINGKAALRGILHLHTTEQHDTIGGQQSLIDDTCILQHTLFETDATQQAALLALGGMVLKILAEVALVARLGYSVFHLRKLHIYHMLEFGHELVVAFL